MNIVLTLLFVIQSLWFSLPAEQIPPDYDIREARDFGREIDYLFVENGILDTPQGWIIEEYDPEAKTWARFPKPWMFSSKRAPEGAHQKAADTFRPLFAPPPGWRAGTARAHGEIVFESSVA